MGGPSNAPPKAATKEHGHLCTDSNVFDRDKNRCEQINLPSPSGRIGVGHCTEMGACVAPVALLSCTKCGGATNRRAAMAGATLCVFSLVQRIFIHRSQTALTYLSSNQ